MLEITQNVKEKGKKKLSSFISAITWGSEKTDNIFIVCLFPYQKGEKIEYMHVSLPLSTSKNPGRFI